jgi:hypothetical protein
LTSNPESTGSNLALPPFFPSAYIDEMPQTRLEFQVKEALSLNPKALIASKVIFLLKRCVIH